MINVARYLGTVVIVALGTTLSTAVATRRFDRDVEPLGLPSGTEVSLDDALRISSAELQQQVSTLPSSSQSAVNDAVESATLAGFQAAQLLIAAVGLVAGIASWVLFARPAPAAASDSR